MNEEYALNWPVPNEYLLELGRITALWAALESLLNTCITCLAGFGIEDDTPFILITHSSFPQRLDMLSALCEHLKSEHPNLENHRLICQQLKAAQVARNKFAHNGLVYNQEEKICYMPEGSARGKIKKGVTKISVDEIHNVSKVIHEATLSLYELVLKRKIEPVWKNKNS